MRAVRSRRGNGRPVAGAVGAFTKTEAAFQTLRGWIESGRLKPGDRLRAAALEGELGMSPTPIREALRLLQADGLVVHEPHHGTTVAEYSPDDVEEIYLLRAVLEPLATSLAAELASDDELREMRALHDELRVAIEAPRVRPDVAARNAAWHRAVYAAAGSRYLQEFIARLWAAVPVQAMWLTERARKSLGEHERIMVALEKRDAQRASQLMRAHIRAGGHVSAGRLRALQETLRRS